MATYAATISTLRAPADAFDYLATFTNSADWDPGVLAAEQVDAGPVRTGTRFRLTVPFLGRRLRLVYRVTSFQPGHQVVLRAASALLLATDQITVTREDSRTLVSYEAKVDLRGPLRLLDPLLHQGFRRVGDRAAAGLRAALAEVPSGPRPPAG
jgi:dehydrogenase/reductase SDR family protein 12